MVKKDLWLKNNWILLLLLLAAACLRLYHIDYQSLWLDEIHTVNESDPSLTLQEFYQSLCNSEPHPPLYFYMARLSFYFFGHTAFTLRVLSVILGIAGVYSIYLLGKEIHSKKTGLIAALLLAVNYFHIYYSQDGRPYAFLFFATTISFYFLVKFIKNPTVRSSVLYGIFAAFMLYGHLFSLFALCAQCFIVLYFIFWPYNMQVSGKRLFVYSLISGAIVIVLYLPCLEILFISASRTSIWIPKPEPDAYWKLIKEFFGNYDVQLAFVGLTLIFFVAGLIKEKRRHEKPAILKLSALVLFIWIFITLLLPWIKSYLSLPVIVNRYFINILPAVLLLIAIGIMQIKNKIGRYVIVILLAVLSLYNIFIRKDYYNTVGKTQFREATNFIIDNNTNNTPVVTSLGWYFPFFLKNGTQNYTIIERPLEEYANAMIQDSSKTHPFWYIDGHGRPYKVSDKIQHFLDQKFVVEDSYEGFDIWAKHYSLSKNATIDISSFGKLQQNNGNELKYSVEAFEYTGNTLTASGWAFYPDLDSARSKIRLCLIKNNEAKAISTSQGLSQGLTSYFKLDFNADNSGFGTKYNTDELKPGQYQLAIYAVNKDGKRSSLCITDKTINVN